VDTVFLCLGAKVFKHKDTEISILFNMNYFLLQ